MSTEILVALVGLGGALFGAGAAFLGVVYQQRHQAKHAIRERRATMAEAAIDVITTQVQTLEKLIHSQAGEDFEWTEQMSDCLGAIRLSALRIPNKDLREAIEAVCDTRFGSGRLMDDYCCGPCPESLKRMKIMIMTEEVQESLGAYLRGEELPNTIYLNEAVMVRAAFRKEYYEPLPGSDH
ncbi:hypothetical protein AB0I72_19915 [Nocardiopsis sp. NPDC049922]|uniref:hypothetical protein n=1 Tax=Nocardiopsis sp. NPDC049922 TaxID=3155157 RepID=UPI0033F973BB